MGNHRSAVNSANASRQGHTSFWNDDRVALLRLMWANDDFASDIANALGNGCTRLMVIGKANRLNLRARPGWQKVGLERRRLIRVARETSRTFGSPVVTAPSNAEEVVP